MVPILQILFAVITILAVVALGVYAERCNTLAQDDVDWIKEEAFTAIKERREVDKTP